MSTPEEALAKIAALCDEPWVRTAPESRALAEQVHALLVGVGPGAVPDRDALAGLLDSAYMTPGSASEVMEHHRTTADRILALLPSAPATLDREALLSALSREGFGLPYMARVADYPDVEDLRQADIESNRGNRAALDRALEGCVRTTPAVHLTPEEAAVARSWYTRLPIGVSPADVALAARLEGAS